jgi:hypothetical protein
MEGVAPRGNRKRETGRLCLEGLSAVVRYTVLGVEDFHPLGSVPSSRENAQGVEIFLAEPLFSALLNKNPLARGSGAHQLAHPTSQLQFGPVLPLFRFASVGNTEIIFSGGFQVDLRKGLAPLNFFVMYDSHTFTNLRATTYSSIDGEETPTTSAFQQALSRSPTPPCTIHALRIWRLH